MKRKEHKFIDNNEKKNCRDCGRWMDLHNFCKDKYKWDFLAATCKQCNNEKSKKYHTNNQQEICEAKKTYRKANAEKMCQYRKFYYEANKEKLKKWRKINGGEIRIRGRKWYIENREKKLLRDKKRRLANPEKVKAIAKKSYEKKMSTTKGRLSHRMSALLIYTLKNGKNSVHWEQLVGFTLTQLKAHLEKTMPKGYTWDDLDKLHIDHKIPISVHNFEKPEDADFKKCWALKNLQFLPALENISKGAKLEKHFQPSLIFAEE